jgi:hypothetical protein
MPVKNVPTMIEIVRKENLGSTDEFRRRVEFRERAILLESCKGSVVLSVGGCCRTLALLIAVNVYRSMHLLMMQRMISNP